MEADPQSEGEAHKLIPPRAERPPVRRRKRESFWRLSKNQPKLFTSRCCRGAGGGGRDGGDAESPSIIQRGLHNEVRSDKTIFMMSYDERWINPTTKLK